MYTSFLYTRIYRNCPRNGYFCIFFRKWSRYTSLWQLIVIYYLLPWKMQTRVYKGDPLLLSPIFIVDVCGGCRQHRTAIFSSSCQHLEFLINHSDKNMTSHFLFVAVYNNVSMETFFFNHTGLNYNSVQALRRNISDITVFFFCVFFFFNHNCASGFHTHTNKYK